MTDNLTWTSTVPTEPGYYWFRWRPRISTAMMAKVSLDDGGRRMWVEMKHYDDELHRFVRWYPSCQWAGPVPGPKEAKHD